MRTSLFLLTGVLMLSASCVSSKEPDCAFPQDIYVPPNWLVEYRGLDADTVRYSDCSVHLDWDETSKRLLIDGKPYPVIREMSDFNKELNALLRQAQQNFHAHLAHHFPNGADFEIASAISEEEKEAAVNHAAAILNAHSYVDTTGAITYRTSTQVRLELTLSGRRPVGVIFDLMDAPGIYQEREYTLREACQVARYLADLEPGYPRAYILQGSGCTLEPGYPRAYILQGSGCTVLGGAIAREYQDQVR